MNKDLRKNCKGCIWYDQCHQSARCELYDGKEENEDNYSWNEMSYNFQNDRSASRDSYEDGDMIDWYNVNVTNEPY